ncbi:hypothetical protein GIB67_032520 [Kingdonia uniflora]|uniref:Uncharacterized protein n=1 Tax=Kingdonia uniflora TaxID=39325 RepID=A0A7J7L7K8_9MAGN|nr:hypothetical protein GIB67_032520 [Kingdonia uniflora]
MCEIVGGSFIYVLIENRSGLSESSNNGVSKAPATPTSRVSKLSRGVTKSDPSSPSPQPNPRLSIDRSPRSVESKLAVDRKSSRVTSTTTPDKPTPPRTTKGSELQTQLNLVQEDLKKLKEKLASVEIEKEKALEELKEIKRVSEEVNGKLGEALVAQKRAEETTEIEKFRADELEQVGIDAAKKREDQWEKEIEDVRKQHALDVASLNSSSEELQRVKNELAMTSDAKNQALSHVDDATKIAEIHAEKVELLSVELGKMKMLLDSKVETEVNETTGLVKELNSEVDSLKQELEKAKATNEKLTETGNITNAKLEEALITIGQLRIEVNAAKKSKSEASNQVEELKTKAQMLEAQVDEANQLERSASDSLASLMEKLEEKSCLLQEAESEVGSLKVKLRTLEISFERQTRDLEELETCFEMAKQEASEMENLYKTLAAEIQTIKEEKELALTNEKLSASRIEHLSEEKNKLRIQLEISRDEEDKSKKAMESLASALHEVSSEAREVKEKLLSNQTELEHAESQVEDLKLVLKETNENYKTLLDELKHEVDLLKTTVQESSLEVENSKTTWSQKELDFMNSLNNSEEETCSLRREVDRLIGLLKETEQDAHASKKEGSQLQNSLSQAEIELGSLKGVVDEVKGEIMTLEDSLLDKENELKSINQENEETRKREAAALEKVQELSKLLEEAKKKTEENGDLSDSEKDYDLLPKVVEFSAENGDGGEEEKPKVEILPSQQVDEISRDTEFPLESGNGNPKDVCQSVQGEAKMWESCKIGENDLLPEKEHDPESFEGEVDSKADEDSFDRVNGLSSTENIDNGSSSPSKQQLQKKKKPLLHKFGSLLKKKGSSNHK